MVKLTGCVPDEVDTIDDLDVGGSCGALDGADHLDGYATEDVILVLLQAVEVAFGCRYSQSRRREEEEYCVLVHGFFCVFKVLL